MTTAEHAECFQHRRVGPRPFDRRGAAPGHLPSLSTGEHVGQVEGRRLADSRGAGDQHGDATPCACLAEDGADLVTDLPSAEQPDGCALAADGPGEECGVGVVMLRSSSARRCTASTPGAAPSSRRSACSSRSSCTRAPRASPASARARARARCASSSAGSSASTSCQRPSSRNSSRCWPRADASGFVGPRLVGVVGQQGAAVPAQRLGGERPVVALQGSAGGSRELADVDLDVVATREQGHQLLAQDDGARVVEGAPGVVGRLVQTGPGRVPRQARPQGVDHLLAVQPTVPAEGEELYELGGLAAYPRIGGDRHAVADDLEATEKPHLNAHRGTSPPACWSLGRRPRRYQRLARAVCCGHDLAAGAAALASSRPLRWSSSSLIDALTSRNRRWMVAVSQS